MRAQQPRAFFERVRAAAAALPFATLIVLAGALPLLAAPFGRAVPIGGQASDLALDEARGVLYVANFTANRIEVVSLSNGSVQSSMNVAPQPGSLAISPDGRWLAVTHFGNFTSPNVPRNALTLIDLATTARQTYVLSSAPLGVAFGAEGLALVVTATEFLEFDPVTGVVRQIDTVQNVTAKTLPQPPVSFPPNIVAASMAASGDGRFIFGLSDTIRFRYDVLNRRLLSLGYTSTPAFGPRAVSVNRDGTNYTAGWGLFDRRGTLMAQFPDPAGLLNLGGHAYDTARGVIYSQVPDSKAAANLMNLPPPVLQVVDAQNLAVLERIELPENLAGKAVLSADSQMMYGISDSGVLFLPVGQLSSQRRVVATQEDVIVRTNSCDRRAMVGEFSVVDLSGQSTSFTVSTTTPGVRLRSSSQQTPATIQVTVDPVALGQQSGTFVATLTISAPQSIRVSETVRLIIQMKDPDQRGTTINISGKLVDLLADPVRDRYYVLRQDKNQVLVFDGSSNRQLAVLKTGNTPTQMAFTLDRRYLMAGNDNSQIASVFDLETLEASDPIVFPGGHYPRSLAASGRSVLAATRVAGPVHKIDMVDFSRRLAQELPTLGVWENTIHSDSVLAGSPNGASILVAQPDGHVLLYSSSADSFTVSRRDAEKLGGAFAASSYDQFVVGNSLLNSSLVALRKLSPATATSTGFVFVDQAGMRNTTAGYLERVDIANGSSIRPTRIAEPPMPGDAGQAFTRSLAVLASRKAVVNLTTSGVTVLPWDYDLGATPPRITRIVNAGDGRSQIATGSLISVLGTNLSPTNLSSSSMPLPYSLGDTCLLVNGASVPMYFVSGAQINAQLPYTVEGTMTLQLLSPGGASDNFSVNVAPNAPGVFYLGVDGLDVPVPAVYNARNGGLATGSNPVKAGDAVTIYLTGLGRTDPEVDAGLPAPAKPLAEAILPPRVAIGGVELPVDFAGLTPGSAGVYQINARIPKNVPIGVEIPLEIAQGGSASVISVRVIH